MQHEVPGVDVGWGVGETEVQGDCVGLVWVEGGGWEGDVGGGWVGGGVLEVERGGEG